MGKGGKNGNDGKDGNKRFADASQFPSRQLIFRSPRYPSFS